MNQPTIARFVIYTLSPEDVSQITYRRTSHEEIRERLNANTWPIGAQVMVGNPPAVGQQFPALVVRVLSNDILEITGINLRVFLDGTDELWVQNAQEGPEPGKWHWPLVSQEKPSTGQSDAKQEAPKAQPVTQPAKK